MKQEDGSLMDLRHWLWTAARNNSHSTEGAGGRVGLVVGNPVVIYDIRSTKYNSRCRVEVPTVAIVIAEAGESATGGS